MSANNISAIKAVPKKNFIISKNFCHFHSVKQTLKFYRIFISLFHITCYISCCFKAAGINNSMTQDFIFIIENIWYIKNQATMNLGGCVSLLRLP